MFPNSRSGRRWIAVVFIGAGLSHAADLMRIQVLVGGQTGREKEVERLIGKRLEAFDDVAYVTKSAEFLVIARMAEMKAGDSTPMSISATVVRLVQPREAEILLHGRGSPASVKELQIILEAYCNLKGFYLEVGLASSIEDICARIVAQINAGVFTERRKGNADAEWRARECSTISLAECIKKGREQGRW